MTVTSMKSHRCILVVLALLPALAHQRSIDTSSSYVAAVVEYSPVYTVSSRTTNDSSSSSSSVADLNTRNYLKFVEKAGERNVDILVFPESSLSIPTTRNATLRRSEAASYIPDPSDNVAPCDELVYANSLIAISCAAREHQLYIVINHREKVSCIVGETGCPSDGYLIYNTNVAFDRDGRVVARYRKYNLFGEPGVNVTQRAEPSIFKTDFGVTFGQFICFDILFRTPTLNLTRDYGITDIIYSTHWFSELPFGFGVEAQAAWAYANDVNFLAAGHNYPATASGGSGIYVGKEGYVKVVSEDKKSNVLVVAEIPKVRNGKRLASVNRDKLQVYRFDATEIDTMEVESPGRFVYKTSDLRPYTTELLRQSSGWQNETLCDRGLCCDFRVRIGFDAGRVAAGKAVNYYRYRLAVFNGTMSFAGAATGGVKTCGILACLNDTLESCGKLYDRAHNAVQPTTFESIEVTMLRRINDTDHFFMPATFASGDMMPFNATEFQHNLVGGDGGKESSFVMRLTKPRSDLLTFFIFGRNFALDGTEVTKSAGGRSLASPALLVIVLATWCAFAKE